MTKEEQDIIDAIWGDDATEKDIADAKLIIADIQKMSAIMASRVEAGKIAIVPNITLH